MNNERLAEILGMLHRAGAHAASKFEPMEVVELIGDGLARYCQESSGSFGWLAMGPPRVNFGAIEITHDGRVMLVELESQGKEVTNAPPGERPAPDEPQGHPARQPNNNL